MLADPRDFSLWNVVTLELHPGDAQDFVLVAFRLPCLIQLPWFLESPAIFSYNENRDDSQMAVMRRIYTAKEFKSQNPKECLLITFILLFTELYNSLFSRKVVIARY